MEVPPSPSPAAVPPPLAPSGPNPTVLVLAARLRNGASWFYWIAGLSLINTILIHVKANVSFLLGLTSAEMADALSDELPGLIVLSLLLTGLFVLFGFYANKRQAWAFITGLILYALDSLLLLVVLFSAGGGAGFIIGVVMHIWAIVAIFNGTRACNQLNAMSATPPAAAYPQASIVGAIPPPFVSAPPSIVPPVPPAPASEEATPPEPPPTSA